MRLNRAAMLAISAFTESAAPVRFSAKKTEKDDAELYLYDVIGPDFGGISAKDIASALKELRGAKALSIRVNSPGGDVGEALAMYNLIRDFRGETTVKVDGLCASAATVVAMAGDKIVTAEASMWMVHDPWALAIGSAEDLRKAAEALEKSRDVIVNIYAKRTEGEPSEIMKLMAAETWMKSDEAKALGFTDEIEKDDEEEDEETKTKAAALLQFAPRAHAILDKFKHTPIDLKNRGPDAARLAHAQALALRIRNQRAPRAA